MPASGDVTRDGWRVLATSRAFWSHAAEGLRQLEAAGCEVIRPAQFGKYTADELVALLEGCDASLASSEGYDARVFAACPDLKVVARVGVGYDAVDVEAATAAGVVCTNTPGAMVDAVADFAVGLILTCARRISELDRLVHAGGWSELSGTLVSGKTLGIVGYGQIGRAVARRLTGFDMRVLAYDPFVSGSAEPQAEMVTLERLLNESDFVTVHAPACPATARLFDASRFAQMKRTAFFINTSRGMLVDEAALMEALEAETIAGAALDVTCEEPLPADHPLRQAPRVVLTAHNAFNAREAAARMCNIAAGQVLLLMRGIAPAATINPSVYEAPNLRAPRPTEVEDAKQPC